MRIGRSTAFALLCALAAGAALAGCRETTISASRFDGDISIDGRRADWDSVNGFDFEKEKLYLGAVYDDSSLYLLVATSNRSLSMEALRQGLRLRFRPDRENGGVLWLGSPGSVRPSEMRVEGPPGDRPAGAPSGEVFGRNTDERLQRALADLREEVRVFTAAGEDSVDLATADAARLGIEMQPGYERGGHFILEMKVPLARDERHPLALGASPASNDAIVLDLRIPKPEWSARAFERESPGMGDPGQGGGPMGGGGRFGSGGQGPPAGMGAQGLEMTVRIVLGAEISGGS